MCHDKAVFQFPHSLLIFITCCHAIYNTNELQNVVYNLEIAEIPFGFENMELDGEILEEKMPKNIMLVISFKILVIKKTSIIQVKLF